MLTLEFEGYFQMRMATDPDPSDEKRGVSGYTFALAGEPDLDGVLHFQPDEQGAFQRRYGPAGGPQIGVTVRRATRDQNTNPDLVGAKVQFLGAQILENNGVLTREDFFVVHPLHVRITKEGGEVVLERIDWLNPADPDMPLLEATGPQLLRRQPNKFTGNSPEVALATGLPNASNQAMIDNRVERRKSLEILRDETPPDTAEYAALTSRIQELEILHRWWMLTQGTFEDRPIDRRARQLTLQLDGWDIGVNGQVFANTVGADPTRPWRLRFWCGGFDGDALTSYIRGSWEVPMA